MLKVTSAEFQRHFGMYQDKAMREPIAITQHGRDRIVVMSSDDYAELKKRAREVLSVSQLSDADAEAIAAAKVGQEYRHLNNELD